MMREQDECKGGADNRSKRNGRATGTYRASADQSVRTSLDDRCLLSACHGHWPGRHCTHTIVPVEVATSNHSYTNNKRKVNRAGKVSSHEPIGREVRRNNSEQAQEERWCKHAMEQASKQNSWQCAGTIPESREPLETVLSSIFG